MLTSNLIEVKLELITFKVEKHLIILNYSTFSQYSFFSFFHSKTLGNRQHRENKRKYNQIQCSVYNAQKPEMEKFYVDESTWLEERSSVWVSGKAIVIVFKLSVNIHSAKWILIWGHIHHVLFIHRSLVHQFLTTIQTKDNYAIQLFKMAWIECNLPYAYNQLRAPPPPFSKKKYSQILGIGAKPWGSINRK